jgi:hypothetical protein
VSARSFDGLCFYGYENDSAPRLTAAIAATKLQTRSRRNFGKSRSGRNVPRAGIDRGDLAIHRRDDEARKWSKMEIEGGEDTNVAERLRVSFRAFIKCFAKMRKSGGLAQRHAPN